MWQCKVSVEGISGLWGKNMCVEGWNLEELSGRAHSLVHECHCSEVILSFRLGGSKNCIKRVKAIRIAQLLIKSHFRR